MHEKMNNEMCQIVSVQFHWDRFNLLTLSLFYKGWLIRDEMRD